MVSTNGYNELDVFVSDDFFDKLENINQVNFIDSSKKKVFIDELHKRNRVSDNKESFKNTIIIHGFSNNYFDFYYELLQYNLLLCSEASLKNDYDYVDSRIPFLNELIYICRCCNVPSCTIKSFFKALNFPGDRLDQLKIPTDDEIENVKRYRECSSDNNGDFGRNGIAVKIKSFFVKRKK